MSLNGHQPQKLNGRARIATPATTLITGGAGFIGSNLAHRLLSSGRRVIVFDNLSRPGVERNIKDLQKSYPDLLDVRVEDVRDRLAVRAAVSGASDVFHLAAQVAVTTSLDQPQTDFDINLQGTINILEEVRALSRPCPILYTSTNKVYGNLPDVELVQEPHRYRPADPTLRARGVSEHRPLEFCSPYGCSKGAADQYVLDYAKSFGLPTCVFRMSCIYGPRQCGNEDQGWLCHFIRAAMEAQPLTIYGDGRQVRDALFVDDLIDAMLLARHHIDNISGHAFNMGGGPSNTISLLELLSLITKLTGKSPRTTYAPWRTGDQRWYVSDTRSFQKAARWEPRVGVREGVSRLHRWLCSSEITPIPPMQTLPAQRTAV